MDRERARVYVGERGLKERARGVCVCVAYTCSVCVKLAYILMSL